VQCYVSLFLLVTQIPLEPSYDWEVINFIKHPYMDEVLDSNFIVKS
jgi:hypothetical protein